MTLAAALLGGAKSRLLPASIPLRFFASAAIFHVLTWIALFAAAEQATSFRGGAGPALAAIHLLTLGVLTTTAIGASVQLLPVATRRALAAVWPIKLVFWLTVPGLATLVVGMHAVSIRVLLGAALVTTAGLLLFAGLLADNLRRAGSLPVVAAYGWTALASLVGLAGLGIALAIDYESAILPDHGSFALAHLVLGGFGFMGFLALGFSHVLVPMFALAAATLASGMRKRLGLSFALVRVAWAMLSLTLMVGLAALYGYAGANGPTLFGFLLLGGWLLTFLLGILQRIVPFLASMHVTQPRGSPPLVSELAGSSPLKLHALCHCAALTVIAVAIALDDAMLTRVGSAIGLIGAIAFAWLTAHVVRRVLKPAHVH